MDGGHVGPIDEVEAGFVERRCDQNVHTEREPRMRGRDCQCRKKGQAINGMHHLLWMLYGAGRLVHADVPIELAHVPYAYKCATTKNGNMELLVLDVLRKDHLGHW